MEIKVKIKSSSATALGFLMAPMVPSIVFFLLQPNPMYYDLQTNLGFAGIAYCFALFFTAIFGLPIFAILNKYKRVNFLTSTLSGLFIGVIVASTIRFPHHYPRIQDLLVMAPAGAASGFCFWLIWRLGQSPSVA